jgi:PIN domain nuclease of toxin-antitoxin system
MILLDSHVLAWFYLGRTKLGVNTIRLMDHHLANDGVRISALSFFELSVLASARGHQRRIDLSGLRADALATGLVEIAPDGRVSLRASQIRHALADPFDALIVATADIHSLELLTADDRILTWKGDVKRIDARK